MAGLLDFLKVQNPAVAQGLLQAGLSLLQSKGNFGSALGQAGMQGLLGAQQFQQNQFQRQLQQTQLEEMKRKQAQAQQEAQFRAGLPSPATADPQALLHGAAQAGAIPIGDYLNSMKPKAPEYKTVGDSLVQIGADGVKEAYRAPDKPEKEPEALRTLRIIYGEGSPQYQAATQRLANKMTSHAPATQVNVNTAKPLLNTLGEGLGKQIDSSLGEARAATTAIATSQRLLSAIDSGKIVSGPGAKFRIFGLQVGQMLGVGGKDGAEVLSNTRSAIQSMAQAELDAAQQMKGQGQITEAERDIIKRAASGDIDSLTPAEMRLLAVTMEKTARRKIGAHKRNLEGLTKMPGAEPLLPFYQLDEPPPYAAPAGEQRVRRYNPATGRLE